MSLLSQGGIIITAYLAAGRVGAVTACLIQGFSPWQSLVVAMGLDFFQIPVYGFILERSGRHLKLPERLHRRLKNRMDRVLKRVQENRFWKKAYRLQALGLVVVSAVPFRGFGILSACILAALLGQSRFSGTMWLMTGSFIGSILVVWSIFFVGKCLGVSW